MKPGLGYLTRFGQNMTKRVLNTDSHRDCLPRRKLFPSIAGIATGYIKQTTMALLVLGAIMAVAPPTLKAATDLDNAPAPLIKAAYLYKFIFFTQWPALGPADNGGTTVPNDDSGKIAPLDEELFIIGIIGEDDFGNHFQPIEGRKIASLNRTITVKRLGRYKKGLNLRQCHMLFVCASEAARLPEILRLTGSAPILTVGDSQGFAEQGIMINLVTVNDRIRWELNLDAIRKAGLSVSSTLIQSAVNIFSTPQE